MKKYRGKQLEKDKLLWMLFLLINCLIFSCKNVSDKKVLEETKDSIKNAQYEDATILSKYTNDTVVSYIPYNDEFGLKDWKVEKSKILFFLRKFDSITPYDWNQCYGSYKRGIRGDLVYLGKEYKYHLNAGGWIHLIDNNDELFFGTKNKSDSIFFMSTYFCDEEWD